MSDVHMWDYVLHSCDIQDYAGDPNLLPGNVLNWKNLEFQTVGTVVVEEKNTCHFWNQTNQSMSQKSKNKTRNLIFLSVFFIIIFNIIITFCFSYLLPEFIILCVHSYS